MASTTKNAEHPAESPTPTAPVPGAPKAADGSVRTQPAALEIPVTVNGARTVEGSDKREPFSESTKTVLIFNHGAVIRIATPVAAGQLLFLTNEKSKKEVVCQVVKSKPGPGAGYVELQFTEPAAGFWGMRFPTAPAAPAAPPHTVPPPPRPTAPTVTRTTMPPTRQVSPAAPVPPTSAAFAPSPQAAAPPAPPVTPKPAAPALSAPVPPKPAAAPPTPLPVAKTETPKPLTPPPAPLSFAPPQAPLPPVAGGGPPEGRGIPEIHDYSQEIAKIFAVPPVGSSQRAPTSSASPAQPASSQPSTQDLKQQAAGLQVQLGSMLFTESPAAPPAPRPEPPAASNTKSSLPEAMGSASGNSAQKAPEVKAQDAEPAPRPLPKPVPAAKSKAYDIEQVEEVKVPDWLAPLSRNAESTPVAAPASAASEQSRIPGWLAPLSHIAPPAPVPTGPSAAAPADVAAVPAGPSEPTASQVLAAVEPEANSDDAPFGGKMLDESLESVQEASTAGSSKKGLFLGLAAAALLLAGGGVWYMRQTRGGNSGSAPAKAVEAPVSSPTVEVNTPPVAKPEATVPPTGSNSSSATFSPVSAEPAKNTTPAVSPLPPTAPKNSPPLTRSEPPAEQPKKPSLGAVRLSAPVVSRAKNSPQSGDADPSLGTSMPTPGAESLSSLSANTKQPVAPVEVGGDVKAARLVKSVPPVYPAVARTQRIGGNVSIDAVVETDGNVSTMKVLSGPAILHRAALDAVKQWHYEPAMLNGKPTASHLTVTVQFRLQ